MSERDKWGRIPVTMIEEDQEFCAWRWGELPCRAGPQSNAMVYTSTWGEDPYGTTGDVISLAGFQGVRLGLATTEFVNVNKFANNPIPSYSVTENIRLHASFVFDPSAGAGTVKVTQNLIVVDSPGAGAASFTLKTDTEEVNSVTTNTQGITFEDSDVAPGFRRCSFFADLFDVNPNKVAYYPNIAFEAIGIGSGDFEAIQPQISFRELTEYRATEEDSKLADSKPCFNTLSSCQSVPDYRVKGLNDALRLQENSELNYPVNLVGARDEGLYVEFYYGRDGSSAASSDPDQELIDFGGALSVFLDPSFGTDSIVFRAANGSQISVSDVGSGQVRKLSAFLSKSGSLRVSGSDSVVQDGQVTAALDYLKIKGTTDSTVGDYFISDLIAYDYEVKQVDSKVSFLAASQKGDLTGDAVFYSKLNRVAGLETEDGLTPTVTGDPWEVIANGFRADRDFGTVNLFSGFFFTTTTLLEPPLTLRYTKRNQSSRLPETLGTIPNLISVSNKASQLSVGGTNENVSALGTRDELNIEFEDHPYSDFLTDPYRDTRGYNPEDQGTYWGKWEARNIYKQGFAVRHVSGYELSNGGLERTSVYNYILEKQSGPDSGGKVQHKCYDILQSLRADRAVFPAPSPGFLAADIGESATSFTLDPVGVGEEYPASFRCRIGGEGFDVARSGDVCTITTRGLYGGLESHEASDTVQVVARFEGEEVHDIAYKIITTAIPELQGNIPKAKWDGLASDFLNRLYSADITEPTGVEDLLAELVQTAPIYFYTDIRSNLIELGVIREPSSVNVELREGSELIADSVNLQEYPKERIDEVWIYYRIRDAAGKVDESENYSQRYILVNPEEQDRRGKRSIKRIYSRWIVGGAFDIAREIAQAFISRFQNQPIRVSFDLDAKEGDIWLGDVAKLITRQKQDEFGNNRSDLNYQVIKAEESKAGHQFRYVAQSYEFFSPVDPDKITITIQPQDTVEDFEAGLLDTFQIDLRELYDATAATEVPDITFVVAGGPLPAGGTVVGAGSAQTWSMNVPNDWPWSPSIELRIEEGGVVAGRGGDGGDGGPFDSSGNGAPGGSGQTGLKVAYPITANNLGIIGGGGGGGGGGGSGRILATVVSGGGGGGGAGRRIAQGGDSLENSGEDGSPGTFTQGGTGGAGKSSGTSIASGAGGNGGDLGQAGQKGQDGADAGGSGGSPGLAIDGISNVTFVLDSNGNEIRGDIRGSTAP